MITYVSLLLSDGGDEEVPRLQGNKTLHRQIVELIEASGTEGTTITVRLACGRQNAPVLTPNVQALSQALCMFDRRIVELVLSRMEQYPPPPHLADLGICQLQESAGRERRFKYFTMTNFHILAQKENMSSAYLKTDLSHAGDFLDVDDAEFYEDEEELNTYVDNFQPHAWGSQASSKKPKNPKAVKVVKDKPVKPPKAPKAPQPLKRKNPTLADGTVKKGRPRKYARGDGLDGDMQSSRGKKRKRDEEPAEAGQPDGTSVPAATQAESTEDASPPPKKRRGRPPKAKPGASETPQAGPSSAVTTMDVEEVPQTPTPKTPAGKTRIAEEGSARRSSRRLTRDAPAEPEAAERHVEPDAQKDYADRAPSPDPADDTTPLDVQAGGSPSHSAAERQGSVQVLPAQAVAAPIQVQETPHVPLPHTSPEPRITSPEETTVVPSALEPQPAQLLPSVSNDLIDPALLDTSGLIAFDSTADGDIPDAEGSLSKRSLPSPIPEYPSKRAKTVGFDEERGKGNISYNRRENEFMQMITEAGGMFNISSKDFGDTHAALLARLMKDGQPVSSRATASRADRRTVDATLNSLEARGKLKLMVAAVTVSTGNTRRIKVAYLPETSEEDLANFLAEVGRGIQPFPNATPLKTLDVPLDYRRTPSKAPARSRTVEPLERDPDPVRNVEQADALFSRDEETIRESLLTEKNTVAQLYGYISGKPVRARALHLLNVKMFESQDDTPGVVSKSQRVIHRSLYHQHISIGDY